MCSSTKGMCCRKRWVDWLTAVYIISLCEGAALRLCCCFNTGLLFGCIARGSIECAGTRKGYAAGEGAPLRLKYSCKVTVCWHFSDEVSWHEGLYTRQRFLMKHSFDDLGERN